MKPAEILSASKILDQAMLDGREVQRITATHPLMTLEEGYLVQDQGVAQRLARGEKLIGLKMGFTSQAKREQMGLHQAIYGILTDRMRLEAGSTFNLQGKIHPKIEPEIAFFISKDLSGKISHDQVLDSCSGVCAAMEILDSRFVGFKYFSLPDVVADNCSSSYFVLGEKIRPPREVSDLAGLQMNMEIDGKPVQSALSSAISGDPVNSIIELCEILHLRGKSLKAGSIVMAGAATQAVQLEKGNRVRLTVDQLGTVELNVTYIPETDARP